MSTSSGCRPCHRRRQRHPWCQRRIERARTNRADPPPHACGRVPRSCVRLERHHHAAALVVAHLHASSMHAHTCTPADWAAAIASGSPVPGIHTVVPRSPAAPISQPPDSARTHARTQCSAAQHSAQPLAAPCNMAFAPHGTCRPGPTMWLRRGYITTWLIHYMLLPHTYMGARPHI